MNKEFTLFKDATVDIIEKIAGEEQNIQKAAEIMARSLIKDKLIHAIGTGGHSNMGAEEMFWRAGLSPHVGERNVAGSPPAPAPDFGSPSTMVGGVVLILQCGVLALDCAYASGQVSSGATRFASASRRSDSMSARVGVNSLLRMSANWRVSSSLNSMRCG